MQGEIKYLKRLAKLSQKEASLKLKVYEKYQEVRNEIVRLGGLIAYCEKIEPNKAKVLREKYLELFNKYFQK